MGSGVPSRPAMDTRHSSPARLIAPAALVVFAITALVIIASAGGSGHKSSSGPTKAEQRDLRLKKQSARRQRPPTKALSQSVYVVRTGDTLGSIAQRAGLTIERLQELNPSLDPQALVSGQRIKLR
jgi:LysM repeat protein